MNTKARDTVEIIARDDHFARNKLTTVNVIDHAVISSDPTVMRIVARLEDEAYFRKNRRSMLSDGSAPRKRKRISLPHLNCLDKPAIKD